MIENEDRSALSAKQEASANEIVEAAARAFSRRGYAATSIDDIADLLGCTKGRIYHYFRTKGDLFFGIHKRSLEWALEAVVPFAEDPALSPTEKLRAMVRGHALHMMRRADFVGPAQFHTEMNLAREGRTKDAETRAVFQMRHRFEQCYIDVVAAGVATGEFREGDPRLMTLAALGAVNWMNVWYRSSPAGEEPSEQVRIADELAEFAVRGVLANPTG